MTASHAMRQRRLLARGPGAPRVPAPRGFSPEGPRPPPGRGFPGAPHAGIRRPGRRSGQAILESCIVVALMSLILFGLIEIARLFMGREVLHYAATVGARAHAVGFNDFMIFKTVRVATIPVAGKLTHPTLGTVNPAVAQFQGRDPGDQWDAAVRARPTSTQYDLLEASRIPLYLGAEDYGQLSPILNYEDWDQQRLSSVDDGSSLVNTSVRQDVQLKFAFHRAFWGADEITEAGNVTMDSHYQLYLDPMVQP